MTDLILAGAAAGQATTDAPRRPPYTTARVTSGVSSTVATSSTVLPS